MSRKQVDEKHENSAKVMRFQEDHQKSIGRVNMDFFTILREEMNGKTFPITENGSRLI